jgi:hypothetical protein
MKYFERKFKKVLGQVQSIRDSKFSCSSECESNSALWTVWVLEYRLHPNMWVVNLVGTNFGGQGFFGASVVFGWSRKHKHFVRISHAKLFSSFCATNCCHIQVTSTAPFCKACCLQVLDICFSYPNRTYKVFLKFWIVR